MKKKKVQLIEFDGNNNIGLYVFANDKFCLIPHSLNKKYISKIEETLGVPIYKTTVLNTDLMGVFLNGNNEFLVVPKVFDSELERLKEICEKHEVKLIELEETLNTFGNNLLILDDKVIVNAEYKKPFIDKLSKKLDKKVISFKLKEHDSIAPLCAYQNEKLIVSQFIDDDSAEEIDEINKIEGLVSINRGGSYIKYGVIGNSNGILISEASSTIEIQNIVELLDYI